MNFLFVRGLMRHQGHWFGFTDKFKHEKNMVLTLDIPGNGDEAHLNSPSTISEMTDFLREKFLKLKHDGQWILIGISMGGMIALDWQNRYPNDFNRLFIINTSTKDSAPPWKRFSLNTFLQLPVLLFATPFNIEKKILQTTLNIKKIDHQLIDRSVNLPFTRTSKINFIKQLIAAAMFKSPNFSLDDGKKIVFIIGLKDQLVTPHAGKFLAQKYRALLIEHAEAGHDLPLDNPEWLYQAICDLLPVD